MFNSPSTPERLKMLILGLLWRVAVIGGSFTLIIRFGIVSWIKSQIAINNGQVHDLIVLATKLEETCNDAKIHNWNHGVYNECLAELRRIRNQNENL